MHEKARQAGSALRILVTRTDGANAAHEQSRLWYILTALRVLAESATPTNLLHQLVGNP